MATNISTATQLQNMKDDLAEDYTIVNDIDMDGIAWDPVGTAAAPFTGTLDGGNYTISNLNNITIPAGGDYLGLFGKCAGAAVENVTMTGFEISIAAFTADHDYWGGLIGELAAGTVTNCSVSGTITIDDMGNYDLGYCGGLIGTAIGAITITDCWTNVEISLTSTGTCYCVDIAGLIGDADRNVSGTITNCYALGDITTDGANFGAVEVGGLIGELEAEAPGLTISYCYATGDVTSLSGDSLYFGGWSGGVYHTNSGELNIHHCYATGDVTMLDVEDSFMNGGFCTDFYCDKTWDCYATGDVYITCIAGTSTYHDYIGGFCGNIYMYSYYGTATYTKDCYSTGTITLENSDTVAFDNEIGGFCGSFYISSSASYPGPPRIEGCWSTSDINYSGSDRVDDLGGFCGYPWGIWGAGTYLQKCFYEGDIVVETSGTNAGNGLIGGFIGELDVFDDCIVKDCYAKGSITINVTGGTNGVDQVGGMFGYLNLDDNCVLANMYSGMDITITVDTVAKATEIGGFVGEFDPEPGTLGINLFSYGTVGVTDTNTNTGGFCGKGDSMALLNCYYWPGSFSGNRANGDGTTVNVSDEATAANFYEKTHAVYNQTEATFGGQTGSYDFDDGTSWGFPSNVEEPLTTPQWYTNCLDYPDFVGSVCPPTNDNSTWNEMAGDIFSSTSTAACDYSVPVTTWSTQSTGTCPEA